MQVMKRSDIQAELTAINNAIKTILATGQSVTITTPGGTRQVSMASISTLYKRKEKLERMLRGGPRFRRGIPV
ncbi:hypothetical protein ABMX62_22520 [Vibrio vulnificus]|uniref:hypothetical protein n=1 Tax=Vibrio vulnificus TaxID=672 RepID=UPI004059FFDA